MALAFLYVYRSNANHWRAGDDCWKSWPCELLAGRCAKSLGLRICQSEQDIPFYWTAVINTHFRMAHAWTMPTPVLRAVMGLNVRRVLEPILGLFPGRVGSTTCLRRAALPEECRRRVQLICRCPSLREDGSALSAFGLAVMVSPLNTARSAAVRHLEMHCFQRDLL